jgi:hypothetical protein
MEGLSDVEIRTIRLRNKADIGTVMAEMPKGCDIATLDRTDGQSNITHEIWRAPGYMDLNDRLREQETQEKLRKPPTDYSQDRFVVKLNGPGSWFIQDKDAGRWNMPEKAVSIFMRREAAEAVAEILNKEWRAFVRNPS